MELRQFDKQINNHSHNHQHHYYDSKSTSSSACFALMSLSAKRRTQCRPSPSRPAEHEFNASTWEEEQSESMQLPTEDPACIISMQPSEHLLKENTIGKGSVDKSFTSDNVYMNTSKERNHIKRVLHKAHDTLEDKLVNNGNSSNKEDTQTYEYNNKFNNNDDKNKYSLFGSRSRESPSSLSTLSSSLLLSNKLEWYRSSQSNQESSQLHHTYHCVYNKHENDSVHLNFARLFSSHQRLLSTTLTEKAKSSKRARQEVRDKESAHINCFRNTKNVNNDFSSRSESKSKGKRSSSRKSNFNVDNKISNGDKSHKYNICSGRNNSHTHNNTSSSNNKNKIKEENSSIKVANKYNNYALQSARYIRTHSKLQDVPCTTTNIDNYDNYNSNNSINSGKNSTKVHNYANADKVTEKRTHADIKHTTNIKEQCQKYNAKMSTQEQRVEEEVKRECEETENCLSESHKCPNSKKTLLTSSSLLQTSLLPSSSPTTSLVETSLLPEMLVHLLSEHSASKQTKASAAVEHHLCNNAERCHTNNERHQKYNHSVNEQKSKSRQTELSRSISKKRQNSKSADKREETNKSSISTTTTTTSTTNTKCNRIKSTMKTLVKPTTINVSKEQRRRELYA